MFKLIKYCKKWQIYIILILILTIFQVILSILTPTYLSLLINNLTTIDSTSNIVLPSFSKVIIDGIILLSIVIGYILFLFLNSIIAGRFSYKIGFELRNILFAKVIDLSVKKINKYTISSLLTRTTDDINKIENGFTNFFTSLIFAPLLFIFGIGSLSIECVGLLNKYGINDFMGFGAIMSLTVTAIFILLIYFMFSLKISVPRFKRAQKLTDQLNAISRDTVNGVMTIRAFNGQQYHSSKYDELCNGILKNRRFASMIAYTSWPIAFFVRELVVIGTYVLGGYLLKINPTTNIDYAMLVKLSAMSSVILFAAISFGISFSILPRAIISAKRVNEIINEKNDIIECTNPITSFNTKGQIEFKNVIFSYDENKTTLDNISFSVKPGKVMAIVGFNGSGKTTIADLLMRLYEPNSGNILLNNIDIKDISLATLRNSIAYISQKPFLFGSSIKHNIVFNNDVEFETSAIDAQIHNFITTLPQKYDSHVAQLATNLSGGQKQRITIARALAKKPQVIIFDDSFSALDYKTDSNLRNVLSKKYTNVTKIIIAQRISTIMSADNIIVLDKGKIVGTGNHKTLLKSCPLYKKLTLSQMSLKEATYV